MLGITDLKQGTFFEFDGAPYQVVTSQHSKTGRSGAVLKSKIRNLFTGAIIDKTFKGSDQFEEADISRVKGQFLYSDGENAAFMDNNSYEQHELNLAKIADAKNFLKEGMEIDLVLYNNAIISVNLPPKIALTVTYTEPGIKGDTQSSATKPATMETGLITQVPLFIKDGDEIIIDTRTGDYVERA